MDDASRNPRPTPVALSAVADATAITPEVRNMAQPSHEEEGSLIFVYLVALSRRVFTTLFHDQTESPQSAIHRARIDRIKQYWGQALAESLPQKWAELAGAHATFASLKVQMAWSTIDDTTLTTETRRLITRVSELAPGKTIITEDDKEGFREPPNDAVVAMGMHTLTRARDQIRTIYEEYLETRKEAKRRSEILGDFHTSEPIAYSEDEKFLQKSRFDCDYEPALDAYDALLRPDLSQVMRKRITNLYGDIWAIAEAAASWVEEEAANPENAPEHIAQIANGYKCLVRFLVDACHALKTSWFLEFKSTYMQFAYFDSCSFGTWKEKGVFTRRFLEAWRSIHSHALQFFGIEPGSDPRSEPGLTFPTREEWEHYFVDQDLEHMNKLPEDCYPYPARRSGAHSSYAYEVLRE
jgi:hypothetical protein